MFEETLRFWFEEIDPKMWWESNPTFDALIQQRFQALLQRAARGELYGWRTEPRGRLAEVIVLDQFSRNIYRNTPLAYAQDPMALVLAQEAIALGHHLVLSQVEISFLLLPYMHSESEEIHVIADRLYKEHAPGNYEFEVRHREIIDRFSRYPHRNQTLGRISSAEEVAFLKQPGSSF